MALGAEVGVNMIVPGGIDAADGLTKFRLTPKVKMKKLTSLLMRGASLSVVWFVWMQKADVFKPLRK